MTPRRRDDDSEDFDAQFDDDVFATPDAGFEDAPAPKKKRKPRAFRRRPKSEAEKSHPRGRRFLRVAGIAALALVLISFIISFVAGLGGGSTERIVGDAEEAAAELDRMGPRVRVEVLNAGGVAGLARRATEHLRDRGFDVVAFGNASVSDRATTVALARTSDVDDARDVAAALGTDSVVVEPDPQLYLDVTVMLGRDWPPVTEQAEEERGFLAWFRSLF